MRSFLDKFKNCVSVNTSILLVLLVIIGILIYWQIVRHYRYDKALYLFSALIQSEVTLFAIIFSITLVVSQIIAAHYKVSPLRIILTHPKLNYIWCVFVVSIISGILSLIFTYSGILLIIFGSISLSSGLILICELFPFTKAMVSLTEIDGLFDEIVRNFPNPVTEQDIKPPRRERWFDPLKNLLNTLIIKNDYSDLLQLLTKLNDVCRKIEIEPSTFYDKMYSGLLTPAIEKDREEVINVIFKALLHLAKASNTEDERRAETSDVKLNDKVNNVDVFCKHYNSVKNFVILNLNYKFLVDRFFDLTHELILYHGNTEIVNCVVRTLTDIIGSENLPLEFRKQAFEELVRPLKTFSSGFPTDDAIVVSVEIIKKMVSLKKETLQDFKTQFCELENFMHLEQFKGPIKQKIELDDYNELNTLVKSICKGETS